MKTFTLDQALTLLIEECAEVIQACTKIKRFGPYGYYFPAQYNYMDLIQEIADVQIAISIVKKIDELNVTDVALAQARKLKLEKLGKEEP